MDMTLENHPKFQTMSPEAQKIVKDKFASMSPEAQQIATKKLYAVPDDVKNEEGLQDVSLAAPIKPESYEGLGDKITEGIAETKLGRNNPVLSAAAGTAFKMIPHVLQQTIGGLGAGEGVKAGKGALEMAATTELGQALKNTGVKEVARLSEKAAQLPISQLAKKELVRDTLKSAGEGIGTAEKALNIGQDATSVATRRAVINTPEKMVAFADQGSRLSDLGAEELAKRTSPERLQFFRKTAEDALNQAPGTISNEARNKLYKIKKTFTDAIGQTAEGQKAGFDVASSNYKQVSQVLDSLPSQFTKEKNALKLAMVRAQNLARKQAPIRKAAGMVAGGAGLGAGATVIKKLVSGE